MGKAYYVYLTGMKLEHFYSNFGFLLVNFLWLNLISKMWGILHPINIGSLFLGHGWSQNEVFIDLDIRWWWKYELVTTEE